MAGFRFRAGVTRGINRKSPIENLQSKRGAMYRSRLLTRLVLMAGLCGAPAGCYTLDHPFAKLPVAPPPDGAVPRELNKVTLPPYVIEPPDILMIQVLLPPTLEDITGIDPQGKPITDPQGRTLRNPFSKSFGPQPIDGQYLVAPDGTVMLGIYGTVHVAGLTRDQARERIREFIAQVTGKRGDALQVFVDVIAYNSKSYYIITDGAGNGAQLYSFPITGSETVLDALARVNGLPQVASRRHIWIARRSPHGGPEQILPVDWDCTVMLGSAATNYQVLPGDRIYVHSQCLISVDNFLAKLFSPVERVFGITLLGTTTVNQISGRGFGFNGQ
jgi:polysaccharide export outer membrane protein